MAWGFESNRIIKLQKKRIITLSNYISHTEPLYKQLSLLKVDDILKLQQLQFTINIYTMTYLAIYKIGGLCLNMRYMVMTQETTIKYTLIKLNMILQRNVSDIICHYY